MPWWSHDRSCPLLRKWSRYLSIVLKERSHYQNDLPSPTAKMRGEKMNIECKKSHIPERVMTSLPSSCVPSPVIIPFFRCRHRFPPVMVSSLYFQRSAISRSSSLTSCNDPFLTISAPVPLKGWSTHVTIVMMFLMSLIVILSEIVWYIVPVLKGDFDSSRVIWKWSQPGHIYWCDLKDEDVSTT